MEKYNFQATQKKHEVKSLHQDLDLTYRILQENHPGLYWYISKENLERKFDSVKITIQTPMTSRQFYQKIAPLIAAIKCGHTAVRLPVKLYKKHELDSLKNVVFPLDQFDYTITDDKKLYIVKAKNDSLSTKRGAQILKIDGEPVNHIIDMLLKTISSDGYNQTHQSATLNKYFSSRYYSIFDRKDSLKIQYELKNGALEETYAKTFRLKKDVKSTIKKEKTTAKTLRYRGKYENGEPQLDFRFLENKQYAYLKIKSFSVPLANYELFYKTCFDSILQSGTENLIIDLRDNGGGSLDASRNLFAYLTDKPFVYLDKPTTNGYFDARKYGNGYQKVNYFLFGHNDKDVVKTDKDGRYYAFMKGTQPLPPNRNNFKGKLFVIINGYTFSAASLFCANLKGIERATLIGEETGGGFNQCVAGTLPVITLKNSKVQLRFGLYRMAPKAQNELYGRGVFPDVNITSSFSDKLNGTDQELNWIINQSKKSK